MLRIARSRYTIPLQLLFLIANGLGVFASFVYSHGTPDLYENNSHNKLGWAITSIATVWFALELVDIYAARAGKKASLPSHAMTSATMEQYDRLQSYRDSEDYRFSRDSGHGTERPSASLSGSTRQNSQEDIFHKHELPQQPLHDEDDHDEDDHEVEKRGLFRNTKVDRFLSRHIPRFAFGRTFAAVRGLETAIQKFLLILGFAAITSGFVVWGGVFRDREIFSGMAHFVKGGIFFWYGLLTLGRWMGAFTEFGWAWNVRPRQPLVSRFAARMPSAEFTESFVIWLYGASNIFMEHMNAWGKAWSAQDLEHLSITFLFFGGGALGMLIESNSVRELLNTTVLVSKSREDDNEGKTVHLSGEESEEWHKPETYETSLNPLPGLVIMLLGIMMSGHQQSSMVSTTMHAQWGTLLVGFALARAATYILMYLKPPTSHFPSRPPSELIAAFCLTAGGLIFMGSAKDTVKALKANGLDAMFVFTVTTGATLLLMGWEVAIFAIKGWALRKERAAAGSPVASA